MASVTNELFGRLLSDLRHCDGDGERDAKARDATMGHDASLAVDQWLLDPASAGAVVQTTLRPGHVPHGSWWATNHTSADLWMAG